MENPLEFYLNDEDEKLFFTNTYGKENYLVEPVGEVFQVTVKIELNEHDDSCTEFNLDFKDLHERTKEEKKEKQLLK
jgi:hypothetical protein